MSTVFRILGIEFSPARLDATHELSKGKTGFEVGSEVFYKIHARMPSFERLLQGMGIAEDSEAAYDIRDMLRMGDSVTLDFVQDFVTGWSHSHDLKKKASDTLGCFYHAAKYLGDRKHKVEFFPGEMLESLGTSDNIPLSASEGETDLRSILETQSPKIEVKDCNLIFGETAFLLPPELEYNDHICRSITKFFGKVNDALYVTITQAMQEEHFNNKVNKVRRHIASQVATGMDDGIPNFFEQD